MKKCLLFAFVSILLSGCSAFFEDVQEYQVYDTFDVNEILDLYGKNYEDVTMYFSNDEKGEEETTLGETILFFRRHTARDGNYDFRIRFDSMNKAVDIQCVGILKDKGYDWNIEMTYKLSCLIDVYYKGQLQVEYWAAYSFSDVDNSIQTTSRSDVWNKVRTFPLTESGYMAEYYDKKTVRTMLSFDAQVGAPYLRIFYRKN